jgi:histidine triad (HIT) family protein
MGDCIFCKIIAGEIPSKRLFEDDDVIAFADISPQAPVHFLVVPKRHIPSVMETTASDAELLSKLLETARTVAKAEGLGERGCRFVINSKEDGLQSVPHLHIHILGGRKLGWPPG